MAFSEIIKKTTEITCEQCGAECGSSEHRVWTTGSVFCRPQTNPSGKVLEIALHFCGYKCLNAWSDEHVIDGINVYERHKDAGWVMGNRSTKDTREP